MASSNGAIKPVAKKSAMAVFKSSAQTRGNRLSMPPLAHRGFSDSAPAPTLEEFLAAPHAEIARIAPSTVVYAASGTRRQAALAGINPQSDAYARWSHTLALDAVQMTFDHGVRHVFTLLAGPGQFHEVGAYRARLLDWIEWGIASDETMAAFRQRGWSARLLCDDSIPQLVRARQRLATLHGPVTIWFQVIPDAEAPWRWLLDATHRSGARTRCELVQALYGEPVPLVSLYLAFGKPVIAPELLPPLLVDTVQCYWSQRPGYSLTQDELRRILYDYAYLRPTWQADKTGRAEEALVYADVWNNGAVLGLGQRLGPFWYPLPFAAPHPATDNACLDAACIDAWERTRWLSAP